MSRQSREGQGNARDDKAKQEIIMQHKEGQGKTREENAKEDMTKKNKR